MKTVIEMAVEAELIYNEEGWCGWVEDTDLRPFIERFAALVAATEQKKWQDQAMVDIHEAVLDEREACACLRKEVELQGKWPSDYEDGFFYALEKYEDMIRARGETK